MATRPSKEDLKNVEGLPVYPADGGQVGTIERVYFDQADREPEWVGLVSEGKHVLVPAEGAQVERGSNAGLRVPYSSTEIKGAPEAVLDVDHVTEEMMLLLRQHYSSTPTRPDPGTAGRQRRGTGEERYNQAGEASQVPGAGQSAAERAEEAAARARASAASGLHTIASTVRDRSEQQGGRVGQVGRTVAGQTERAANYLGEHDTRAIVQDARSYPYRHPFQMLAAAAVGGFILGRVIAPKRQQQPKTWQEKSWQERMNDVRRESALMASAAFEQGRGTAATAYEQGRQAAMVAYDQGKATAGEALEKGRDRWAKTRRQRTPWWKRAIRLGR